MTHDKAIELDKQYMMQTYGRLPLVPAHGKGARLTDEDGKVYIDFTSGIGVNSLGFVDEGWADAVTKQLWKIQHFSNYYYSSPTGEVAEMLVKASGMKRAFFGNSGAEANEGAIKVARKYSYDKYGKGRATIITLCSSFHGRTVTTLAATGQDVFHDFFFPFTEGFKYVPANNLDALKEALTEDVCAVMAEPIQGEGGVNILTDDYMKALRSITEEKDILLILDEVQTGIARTGMMFGYQYSDILPDILTLAKGLGGGLPIGVFMVGEKCEATLSAGQHGTTFGGNPVAAAGAKEVLSRVCDDKFLFEIRDKGEYIRGRIKAWDLPNVGEIRGRGLMIGIQIKGESPKDVLHRAFDNGLLTLTAGSDVLRLLPPLTITYDEIDDGLTILKKSLESEG
ncbi:MAG: aspartate aminotransferase family protein [Clostridia bacterium]|nr:aspartate aminotransferase family protein [Clostridia bacterium]